MTATRAPSETCSARCRTTSRRRPPDGRCATAPAPTVGARPWTASATACARASAATSSTRRVAATWRRPRGRRTATRKAARTRRRQRRLAHPTRKVRARRRPPQAVNVAASQPGNRRAPPWPRAKSPPLYPFRLPGRLLYLRALASPQAWLTARSTPTPTPAPRRWVGAPRWCCSKLAHGRAARAMYSTQCAWNAASQCHATTAILGRNVVGRKSALEMFDFGSSTQHRSGSAVCADHY